MAGKRKSSTKSVTPMSATEAGNNVPSDEEPSSVTDEELEAMNKVWTFIHDYKDESGNQVSLVFHRMVNKRSIPDYYKVIAEPMAMSVIKTKLQRHQYKRFEEFVRDMALIPHNAQTYNRPDSGVYQESVIVKSLLESQMKELVEQKVVSAEAASLPDLGEIPPMSPTEEDGDEEDEDDDDEDEDEDNDSEEEGTRKRKRPARRSSAAISKREAGIKSEDGTLKGLDADPRKRRGRPPRVDTPMEARIKAVLKGMRKLKNSDGTLKVGHFERLPDKAVMPEYFAEIKNPMALDTIKKKAKRKKYQSVDHFMKDVDIMFENAKSYNLDDSEIYKDAVELQKESRILAEQEKQKPDTEYLMEDGKLPLPNGILHNGELWKVGDWVHITNPNDPTKPIVAQIYRTWQDSDGQKWVNACWYYRPEQTVHRYEKHFFDHEVVKTGQYRDHHIDEVVDKCFVMFFTRFNKGRPRGFPVDKEVYVCESRYNEEKHKLNKIKTWASCLPDEVRDKDYEMDLFDAPRKMKKIPSPIKHLLKEDAKEDDPIPDPTWGSEVAPPVVGAVHKRPREANESPPPEPTPSPPPQLPPPPPRQLSNRVVQHREPMYAPNADEDTIMGGTTPRASFAGTPGQAPSSQVPMGHQYTPRHQQQSASPAPAFNPSGYPQAATYSSYATPSQTPQALHQAQYEQRQFGQPQYSSTPASNYGYQHPTQVAHAQTGSSHRPNFSSLYSGRGLSNSHDALRQSEVYVLNDKDNSAIPEDIRQEYHTDDQGRIMFFTTPPVDNNKPPINMTPTLGHSAKYVAWKANRAEAVAKRKAEIEVERVEREEALKKAKMEEDAFLRERANELLPKALDLLVKQTTDAMNLKH